MIILYEMCFGHSNPLSVTFLTKPTKGGNVHHGEEILKAGVWYSWINVSKASKKGEMNASLHFSFSFLFS